MSGTSLVSPAPKTWQWLAKICSISVVPDRGSPTTNTGSSLSNPKPRTRSKKSAVQAAIMRSTKTACPFGSYSWPRAPRGQLQRVAPIEVHGGLGILAPRIEDLGQAEVQQQSLFVRQVQLSSSNRRWAARSWCGSLPRSSSANL